MQPWISRGLALALLMVVIRSLLSVALEAWAAQSTALRLSALVAFALAAAAYGARDGYRDRLANPDPAHGEDLTIRWLSAGLTAGVVAGCTASLLRAMTPVDLGNNSWLFEITSGAAWTMLLIFASSTVGIAIARVNATRTSQQAPLAQPASTV
ncbi:B-4DMT family transporter [Nocardia gamkensis]|uniref:B-4DMT family transporter n=1 Tax=Nocardia gamkensis TaxID=352869 RepID=UPI0037CC1DAB